MNKINKPSWEFAICLEDQGYPASLEVAKLYRVVPDSDAATHGYIRVIDESGGDYLFTAKRFHVIQLPANVGQALAESK